MTKGILTVDEDLKMDIATLADVVLRSPTSDERFALEATQQNEG